MKTALPTLPRFTTAARSASVALVLLAAACDPPPPTSTATSAAPSAEAPPAASAEAPAATASAAAAPPEREIAGAAHILVAYKGALGAAKTVARTPADAKKRAEEARKKLVDEKATFEALVKEYSDDDLSKPANGQIGNFERNVMPKPFSDATFNLAVGGVSEVVETPRGFHVIRRTK